MLASLLLNLLPLVAAVAVPGQLHARQESNETERFLAKFGPNEEPIWITADDLPKYKAEGKHFFEVSEWGSEPKVDVVAVAAPVFPTPGAQTATLKPLLSNLSVDWSKTFLLELTKNSSRYYASANGRYASEFVQKTASELVAAHTGATVTPFKHTRGYQDSVIVRLPHTGPADAPVTIVGAHFDTTPSTGPEAPHHAQDDNGSGVTSAMDALRVLSAAKYTPVNPIEFHFYAAEEIGSVGSWQIAKKYKTDGTKVAGMFNLDMTAWVKNGTQPVAGVIYDWVNLDLTHFLEGLIDEYLEIPKAKTYCGYACTDHASWNDNGFYAAYAQESLQKNLNPNADTYRDTVNHFEFKWEHLREFSKLALVFAAELSA